jgi:hypothetical protein
VYEEEEEEIRIPTSSSKRNPWYIGDKASPPKNSAVEKRGRDAHTSFHDEETPLKNQHSSYHEQDFTTQLDYCGSCHRLCACDRVNPNEVERFRNVYAPIEKKRKVMYPRTVVSPGRGFEESEVKKRGALRSPEVNQGTRKEMVREYMVSLYYLSKGYLHQCEWNYNERSD